MAMYRPKTPADKAGYWLKRLNVWRKVLFVLISLRRIVFRPIKHDLKGWWYRRKHGLP